MMVESGKAKKRMIQLSDPHRMTPEEMRFEIAEVLAAGYLRLARRRLSECPEMADTAQDSASEECPEEAPEIP